MFYDQDGEYNINSDRIANKTNRYAQKKEEKEEEEEDSNNDNQYQGGADPPVGVRRGQKGRKKNKAKQQRRVHSYFAPPPPPQLPPVLRNCKIIRDILKAPCEERLNESRYGDLGTVQIYWNLPGRGEEKFTISYSPIHSILTSIVRDYNKKSGAKSCIAGKVEFYLYGDADSKDQQPVPETAKFKLKRVNTDPNLCHRVFVPLSIRWITSPQLLNAARQEGTNFTCTQQCEGHDMALIIDNRQKILEIYEPNGVFVTWFPVVERFMSRYLARSSKFQGYTLLQRDQCITKYPDVGPQGLTQLPMCTYFSNLYALVRLVCEENLDPATIINGFVSLKREGIINFLQRFHCFLVDYAENHGVFDAIAQVRDVHLHVASRINAMVSKRHPPSVPQAEYAHRLRRIDEGAAFDIVGALTRLKALDEQVKREFDNEAIRFGY